MMNHQAFSQIDHRPWACPGRPWLMRQSWCDLLFAHWPVPASLLRPLVPSSLEIDEFDHTSWVGVVPFRMEGVSLRYAPDVPGLSAFPEINLRLYVSANGRPGVWFLSLDATNALAVWAARRFFYLPYFNARISISHSGPNLHYRSVRSDGEQSAVFSATYGPKGDVYLAKPGSLEHWLTERYCLYAEDKNGRILRTEVHHRPWPLQSADALIEENTVGNVHGIELDCHPALVHFSKRIDVVAWRPRDVRLSADYLVMSCFTLRRKCSENCVYLENDVYICTLSLSNKENDLSPLNGMLAGRSNHENLSR
ncbi:MAG: YqjF family protein [Calditrichia bacterium]